MTENINYWNELAEIHSRGNHYPVEQIINGGTTLRKVELALLNESNGYRLLHSHCHIGLDSISLARLGFEVTAIDYSSTSITHARKITELAGVQDCRFAIADSSEPATPDLTNSFDIYFASYGVLVWVPDIEAWFQSAASYLKPGGQVILIDEHPYAATFEGGVLSKHPPVSAPYWQADGPYITRNQKSYSGDHDILNHDIQTKWPHSLGEIITAVEKAGMKIIKLREYPFSHYCSVPEMSMGKDLYYHHPRWSKSVPFLFSLSLVKKSEVNGNA